jgi:hypothetical protein
MIDSEHWYENVPNLTETICEGKVIILWNEQAQADRTVTKNKSDIIMHGNGEGTCVLIDAAISADRNVIKREAEKVLKCTDQTILIHRMWNVETRVTAVIMGAIGTI